MEIRESVAIEEILEIVEYYSKNFDLNDDDRATISREFIFVCIDFGVTAAMNLLYSFTGGEDKKKEFYFAVQLKQLKSVLKKMEDRGASRVFFDYAPSARNVLTIYALPIKGANGKKLIIKEELYRCD